MAHRLALAGLLRRLAMRRGRAVAPPWPRRAPWNRRASCNCINRCGKRAHVVGRKSDTSVRALRAIAQTVYTAAPEHWAPPPQRNATGACGGSRQQTGRDQTRLQTWESGAYHVSQRRDARARWRRMRRMRPCLRPLPTNRAPAPQQLCCADPNKPAPATPAPSFFGGRQHQRETHKRKSEKKKKQSGATAEKKRKKDTTPPPSLTRQASAQTRARGP